MPKTITIDIALDGSVKVEGHGFTGPECAKATKAIEDALGVVTETVRKREYNQSAAAQQREVVR